MHHWYLCSSSVTCVESGEYYTSSLFLFLHCFCLLYRFHCFFKWFLHTRKCTTVNITLTHYPVYATNSTTCQFMHAYIHISHTGKCWQHKLVRKPLRCVFCCINKSQPQMLKQNDFHFWTVNFGYANTWNIVSYKGQVTYTWILHLPDCISAYFNNR